MRARELDEAVTQVLALQEDEDHENRDDAGRREGVEQRRNQRRDALERSGRRLANLDRYRPRLRGRRRRLQRGGRSRRRLLRLVELLAEILKHVRGTFERAARRRRAAQRLDLFTHGELIPRQITGEFGDLRSDHAAEREDAHEGEEDDADDGQSARQVPALQQPNERREHEAEQDGERDRNEHLAPEVERADDDRRNNGGRDAPHGPPILSE
jgi:hypothetical protein